MPCVRERTDGSLLMSSSCVLPPRGMQPNQFWNISLQISPAGCLGELHCPVPRIRDAISKERGLHFLCIRIGLLHHNLVFTVVATFRLTSNYPMSRRVVSICFSFSTRRSLFDL